MNRRSFMQFFGMSVLGSKLPVPSDDEDSGLVYLRNESLPTILDDYKGNVFRDGKFLNQGMVSVDKSFIEVFKWFLSSNPQEKEKEAEDYAIPVVALDQSTVTDDCIIWLGHASFLIGLGGKWILTDPCLTAPPFQERFTELPIKIEDIKGDYILMSHGHYDHLDSGTLERLKGEGTTVLAPLRMTKLLNKMNNRMKVQEAGWYQVYDTGNDLKITFLPAQHWYLRVPWDRNTILWGSFMIESAGKKIYFAGDTGYAGHFEEIGKLFPGIDYALMPIGAYKPPRIMKGSHTSPEEAVRGFNELGAKVFVPMHFGTFDLADEPRGEPIKLLRQLENNLKGKLVAPDIGQLVLL